MIINLYSMKDELVGFNPPVKFDNDQVAIRSFIELMKTDDYKGIRKDLSLYKLGSFDTNSGSFIAELPVKLIDGNSVTGNTNE